MRINVQPIIFPDSGICNVRELYVHGDSFLFDNISGVKPYYFKNSAKISFNTYFNSFSIGKWIRFTNIKEAGLSIVVNGKGVIRLSKAKLDLDKINQSDLKEVFFDSKCAENINVAFDVGDLNFKDTISFEVVFLSEDACVSDMTYWVDIEDDLVNSISLALASCTYKKEKYINKTLSLINEFVINNNPNYNIKTYIVDNGGTLDYDICDKYPRTTLVKSENLGASGGFSRALYCAIKNKDTHVVSLDDDILLNPHSVNLLYNFLRCLKAEYSDYAIAGAMLIYDKQYLQHDTGAYIEKNRLYGIHSNLDLRNYYNCLLNSVQEFHDKTFNGFWFCCYPVAQLSNKGLAYPFFMKGDDVELGIRIFNKKILSLNGICTWHESFYKKFTPVYSNIYELRNLLIIYCTQFEDYNAIDSCKLFVKRALRELLFYRYEGALLNCKGVELFLKGSKGIQSIDNAKIVRENQIYKLVNAIETEHNFSFESYRQSIVPKKEFLLKKLLRIVTINGNLIPHFLLKKDVIVPTVTASIRSVFGYKNIVHYSADDDKIYVTKNSKGQFFHACWIIFKTAIKLLKNHSTVKKDFIMNFPQQVSVESWEERFKQSDRK